MQEKTLLFIALSCSAIGIIILYLFLQYIELPSSDINKLSPSDLSTIKSINGTITKITTKNNTTFITLSQQNDLTVVLFNDPSPLFKKDDKISVIGKVENYQGKYEIIADRVEKIEAVK